MKNLYDAKRNLEDRSCQNNFQIEGIAGGGKTEDKVGKLLKDRLKISNVQREREDKEEEKKSEEEQK